MTSTTVAAVAGALTVGGAVLASAGLLGSWPADEPTGPTPRQWLAAARPRLARSIRPGRSLWTAMAVVVTLLVTGWPVAAVIGGGAAWASLGTLGKRDSDEADRAEAIAEWARKLRDGLGTAMELGTVLRSTAPMAPPLIRADVGAATDRLATERIDVVLDDLSERLGGGHGDLVLAALRQAARGGGRQLRDVLESIAETAQDEAGMIRRVQVAQQPARTSSRLVTGVAAVSMLGSIVLFPDWVAPYGTSTGQLVLGGIAVIGALALVWMARMSRIELPAKFVARRGSEA